LTLRDVSLFNPRRDNWEEHFRPLNHFVAGRTEVGRATANLLFRQTAQAQHSAPVPKEVGSALLLGHEAAYLRWLYGQRKAAQFDTLAKELAPETTVAELKHLRKSLEDGELPGTGALLLIERAAVLAEAVTSRCLVEDLLLGERLCSVAIAVCSQPRVAAAKRLPYFRAKRALVWRQLAVGCAIAGAWQLAKACLRLSDRLNPLHDAVERPLPAQEPSLVRLALPRRKWRTPREMRAQWESVRTEAGAGHIANLLRFVDDVVFRGRRTDAEDLGMLEAMSELVGSSGYGMDADFHHGVLLMRRLILLQGRFEPASISPGLDRHLQDWSAWGCSHNLRSLALGLEFIQRSFGSRVGDALDATRSTDELVPLEQGGLLEIDKLLRAAEAELDLSSLP